MVNKPLGKFLMVLSVLIIGIPSLILFITKGSWALSIFFITLGILGIGIYFYLDDDQSKNQKA